MPTTLKFFLGIITLLSFFFIVSYFHNEQQCSKMCGASATTVSCRHLGNSFDAFCENTDKAGKISYSIIQMNAQEGPPVISEQTCSYKVPVKEAEALPQATSAAPSQTSALLPSGPNGHLLYPDATVLIDNASKSIIQLKAIEATLEGMERLRFLILHQTLQIEGVKFTLASGDIYLACEGKYTKETCPMDALIPMFHDYNAAWYQIKEILFGTHLTVVDPLIFQRYYLK